jgi:replicative DNA helicase Mcm
MRQVGMDPENSQFDADIVETGTSKTQRDRIRNIKGILTDLESQYEAGAPLEEVYEEASALGIDKDDVDAEIQNLKDKGDVYESKNDHFRVV